MAKGLPTRFVIPLGEKRVRYSVLCTIKRPPWVAPEGRDIKAFMCPNSKRIWVFRHKNLLFQLRDFAHEAYHAMCEENAMPKRIRISEKQWAKIEEFLATEVIEQLLVNLWRLGGRWPVWELIAMGPQKRYGSPKPNPSK